MHEQEKARPEPGEFSKYICKEVESNCHKQPVETGFDSFGRRQRKSPGRSRGSKCVIQRLPEREGVLIPQFGKHRIKQGLKEKPRQSGAVSLVALGMAQPSRQALTVG
jgi:hypothetical protein